MTDWQSDLNAVVMLTGTEHYRQLCATENPTHESWRREMTRMLADLTGRRTVTVDYTPAVPSGRSCCG